MPAKHATDAEGSDAPLQTWGLEWTLALLAGALLSPPVLFLDGVSPLFWLPAGIALGALLKRGSPILPSLWGGLAGGYILAGQAIAPAIALASIDLAVFVTAAWLLGAAGFQPSLRQRRDGWLFLGIGVLFGGVVTGLIHTALPLSILGFSAPVYGVPLGIALGSLPILMPPAPSRRQASWPRLAWRWSRDWALPTLLLCWGINTPWSHATNLMPVLALLWMLWLMLDKGSCSAATAMTLTALALGWSLAFQRGYPDWRVVNLWILLMSLGVLTLGIAPLLAELRARDKRMRLALDGTRTGIWDWNMKGKRIGFSPGWINGQGIPGPQDEFSEAACRSFLNPEDLEQVRQQLELHMQGRTSLFRSEMRIQLPGREMRWLIARGRISERDYRGQPLRMLGTLVDVTEQKAAQLYLQLLERALESARDAVAIVELEDDRQSVIFANDAFLTLTGYPLQEVQGKPMPPLWGETGSDLVGPPYLARDLDACPARGLAWIRRRDGSGFWSNLSLSPVRDPRGRLSHYIAIFSDMSAEVRAREHLQERDELLQKLSSQVPGMIFQYRRPVLGSPRFTYASDSIVSLFGITADSVGQDAAPFFARVHPDDRARVEQALNRDDGDLRPWRDEFRVVQDGREQWREGQAIGERQSNGDLLWHGYIKDISEQVRLVMALGESEARFRATANAAPMLIWVAGPEGRCHWFNQAWFDFTGTDPGLVSGSSWLEHLHPDDQAACQAQVTEHWDTRQPFRIECRLRHKDHQWRWIISQGVPRQDENGSFMGYIGACVDIDDQKRVELALRHSREQLRQMGMREEELLEQERKRIASQVHDELGQLLTALKMGISTLRLRFHDVPGLADQVRSLNELSGRAFAVVRQVTTNLRPQALNHGLRAALEWLARETSQCTGLKVHADCPEMYCQPPEAISNALFRLAQEGITNVLKHARADTAEINLSCRGGCLILTVKDDGIGFQPEQASAKAGYGLLGMRERAQALGGHFSIESRSGLGTTLLLSIPVEQNHDCDSCHCCR